MAEIPNAHGPINLPEEITEARLLVVDDDRAIRSGLKRALNLLGYRVEEASLGMAALTMLRETNYDLVLLDLRLPDIDGTEVMRLIQQSHPDVSVIILTGHGSLESAIKAVRAEAADYLLKPVTTHELNQAVLRALHKRADRLQRQHMVKLIDQVLRTLRPDDGTGSASHEGSDQLYKIIQVPPLLLDLQKRVVAVGSDPGISLHLTGGETAILGVLMAYPERVFTCEEIVKTAWGFDTGDDSSAESMVRPHIFRLRRKFNQVFQGVPLIHTLRQRGYFFSTREIDSNQDR